MLEPSYRRIKGEINPKEQISNNNYICPKGITIIAVILIIVLLLILLAIILNSSLNNKLFDTTGRSVDKFTEMKEKEQIRLAYSDEEIKFQAYGESITAETFGETLKEYNSQTTTEEISEEESIDNYEIVVDRIDVTGYANVTFLETGHMYLVALADLDKNAVRYQVTFNANGGEGGPTSQQKIEGKPLRITSDKPTRSGYTFVGWGTSAEAESVSYYSEGSYTEDAEITLYAIWRIEQYTITYNLNGGIGGANPVEYNAATPSVVLINPTKEDFAFAGWTGTGLSEATIHVIIQQGSSGNREYTANWGIPNYIINDGEGYAVTLKQAIEMAENNSVIKAMRNVNDTERAEIDKTVVLDLNGYTLTMAHSITIEQAGNLTIQDSGNNSEYTGAIFNTNATAIVNNGTLQLGNNDGTILVSPAIQGNTTGIVTNGTFKLYDGKVIGTTAIIGENVETPTTYYAMATLDEEKETVELQTLGSAVCRIGYKYYSTIQEAINSTPEGTVSYNQNDNIMIQSSVPNGTYSFSYDTEAGTLKPNNKGKPSTTANSYIEIDLTTAQLTETYSLTINASVSSQSSNDYGYATITTTPDAPAYNIQTGRFMYISGTVSANDYTTTLVAGQKYYLHLGYRKDGSRNTGDDIVTINSIKVNNNDILTVIEGSTVPEAQTKVTLVSDITVSISPITVPLIRNIMLDLNGCVLSTSGSIYTIVNYGKMEIMDSSISKTGDIKNGSYSAIYNCTQQSLTIDGANIHAQSAGTSSIYKFFIENKYGNINIDDSTYTSAYAYTGFANIINGNVNSNNTSLTCNTGNTKLISIIGDNNIVIDGLTITTKGYGIFNNAGATVEINNSAVNYSTYAVYNKNAGTLSLSNCTMTDTTTSSTAAYAIYNETTGTVDIDECQMSIYAGTTIYNKSGNLTVENSEITVGYTAIGITNDSGTVIVNDTTIINANKGISNKTGTVDCENVIITNTSKYSGYGLYNEDAGTINCRNSEMSFAPTNSYNSGYACYNSKTGNINLYNTNIQMNYIGSSSNVYGIYNSLNGTASIESGSIIITKTQTSTKTYGIYNASNGKIIIGKSGDTINSTLPEIEATENGLYNQGGSVEFYDGIIKATTAIVGPIEIIEADSEIQKETQEGIEIATLTTERTGVAKIVETDTAYTSLQEAINACTVGENTYTIQIQKELYLTTDNINIQNGQNITIDLNNNIIYLGKKIINSGSLKITDSSGVGEIISNMQYGISNNTNASLEMAVIKYTNNSVGTSTEYSGGIKNEGTFIFTSGTIVMTKAYVNALYSTETGILDINGGTINNSEIYSYGINYRNTIATEIDGITINCAKYRSCGIYNYNNAEVTVTDVNISVIGDYFLSGGYQRSYGICNKSGTINFISGSMSIGEYSYGIYNINTGTIVMSGGTLNSINSGAYAICNDSTGMAKIIGGTINCPSGINNTNTGTVEIAGGLINTTRYYSTCVLNSGTGTIRMTGGEIYTQCANVTGIKNSSTGTIEVIGGTITCPKSESYGISNSSTGTIVVGQKDGIADKNIPEIEGYLYGIYNSQETKNYFYDGNIKGKTDAIYGEFAEIEDNYNLITELDEDNYYNMYLSQEGIAKIEDTEYSSITAALATIEENNITPVTIKITKNVAIYNIIEIENKNVILDINGKKLILTQITNSGGLEIIDSSAGKTGLIRFTTSGTSEEYGKDIYNTGTLQLNGVDIYTNNSYINTIYNEGSLTTSGGSINCAKVYSVAIYNDTEENTNVSDTTITLSKTNSYGIRNEGIGELTTNNITITGIGESYGIYNASTTKATIIDGAITMGGNKTYGIYNSAGTMEISGICITINTSLSYGGGRSYGIFNNNSGTIDVINILAELNGYHGVSTYGYSEGIYNKLGTVNVISGTFKGNTCYTAGIINESTMNITEATLSCTSYYSYALENYKDGTINIENINITSTGDSSTYGIKNEETGTIIIEMIDISTTKSICIYNTSTGIIQVKNGNVTSTNTDAIYNAATGTIIIGENDGIVIPLQADITGKRYGVYNASTGYILFYDGLIKGETDSLYGSITSIETGYDIIRELNENNYYETWLEALPMVQIGETQYYSITEALNTIEDNSETPTVIQMIRDATIMDAVNVQNKNVIIDLNNKRLKLITGIINQGSLKLLDNSEEKNGIIDLSNQGTSSEYAIGIDNEGKLNIENIDIYTQKSYIKAINNSEISDFSISDGIIKCLNTYSYGIYNNTTNTINISRQIIDGEEEGSYCIYNNATGTIIIDDTDFECVGYSGIWSTVYSYGIYNVLGTINMTNGTVTATSTGYAIVNGSTGVLSIDGTVIEGQYGIYSKSTNNSTISNVSITSNGRPGYAVYNNNTGTVTITNATIVATGGYSDYSCGIINTSSGKVIFNGGSIQANNGYAIKNNANGEIKILDGTLSSNQSSGTIYSSGSGTIQIIGGTIFSTTNNAVYNNNSSSVIIIGEQKGEVSSITPEIYGETYGVYNNSTGSIYFYDGVIKGKSGTFYGNIATLEEGYQINTTHPDSYTWNTLIPTGGAIAVATIDSVNYSSLQDAMQSSLAGDVIVLQRDVTLNDSSIEVNSSKDVTINLNGKSITSTSSIATIQNHGILTIKDTSTSYYGTIENTNSIAIQNNGVLSIGEDDGIISLASPRIIGATVGINNTGTLNYYDGIISGTTAVNGTIAIVPDGYSCKTTSSSGTEVITLDLTEMTISYTINNLDITIIGTGITSVKDPNGIIHLGDTNGNINYIYTTETTGTYAFRVTSTLGNTTVLNVII